MLFKNFINTNHSSTKRDYIGRVNKRDKAEVAKLEAQFTQEIIQMLAPPESQSDPLVQIRQQELAIKAAEAQRRAQQDAAELELERQKANQRATTDAARIELQEEIAAERADVNRERIQTQRDLASRSR